MTNDDDELHQDSNGVHVTINVINDRWGRCVVVT